MSNNDGPAVVESDTSDQTAEREASPERPEPPSSSGGELVRPRALRAP
jgi:hypothetical protein